MPGRKQYVRAAVAVVVGRCCGLVVAAPVEVCKLTTLLIPVLFLLHALHVHGRNKSEFVRSFSTIQNPGLDFSAAEWHYMQDGAGVRRWSAGKWRVIAVIRWSVILSTSCKQGQPNKFFFEAWCAELFWSTHTNRRTLKAWALQFSRVTISCKIWNAGRTGLLCFFLWNCCTLSAWVLQLFELLYSKGFVCMLGYSKRVACRSILRCAHCQLEYLETVILPTCCIQGHR